MGHEWKDDQPIYRQLTDRIVEMLLDGVLGDGDPLPSVRDVAAEYRVNPLTVMKGYQSLVDRELVESRRGRGMYVTDGATDRLLVEQRRHFIEQEWPAIRATVQRLGLDWQALLQSIDEREGDN